MNAQLLLALQPIVNVSINQYVGHEVLSRFCVPPDILPPHPYVKEGEWAKLDADVSEVVLERMMKTHSYLRLPVFMNISSHTLGDTGLFEEWLERLKGIDAFVRSRLVIEVSETTAREALDQRWDALKSAGVKLAIDDFGRENSGFKRLVDFPWDYCKFFGPSLEQALKASALEHCHAANKRPIMECIENEQASTTALNQGCDFQQGFLFARPPLLESSVLILNSDHPPPCSVEIGQAMSC